MTIVVAWADIINKNVRTPCHPEATGRRISQRADRPGDSSHPLRMTGSGWLCLCSSRCHHEGVDATVGSRELPFIQGILRIRSE